MAERITKAGLTISVEKSKFCTKQLNYFGYIVTSDGIKPDPAKISAIMKYALPKCVKDVRRLLGMAGWYRRFIPNFAIITAPNRTIKKEKDKI